MGKVVIWGTSDHAKTLLPILTQNGHWPVAIIGEKSAEPFVHGCQNFSCEESLLNDTKFQERCDAETVYFCVAIKESGRDRMAVHERLVKDCFTSLRLIHPRAWVAETAKIGDGSQILAMAAISEEAHIGLQTIVDSQALVNHHATIGNGCQILSGTIIGEHAHIHDFCTIGQNAVILPGVTIGEGTTIGAGTVVDYDVAPGVTLHSVA